MIFALGEGMGWWSMVRTALSPAEVDEVWRRWPSGQAVKVLSRETRRRPSTVRDLLNARAGSGPDQATLFDIPGQLPHRS